MNTLRFGGHPGSGVLPRKDVHHGEHGEEEATSSPLVHAGVQGRDFVCLTTRRTPRFMKARGWTVDRKRQWPLYGQPRASAGIPVARRAVVRGGARDRPGHYDREARDSVAPAGTLGSPAPSSSAVSATPAPWVPLTAIAPSAPKPFRLAVGQLLVADLLPGRGESVAGVSGLADVQAEEHAHVFGVEHRALPGGGTCRPRRWCRTRASTSCRPAARELSGIAPDRVVAGPLISVSDGTCRARRPAVLLQDREEDNGGGTEPPDRRGVRAQPGGTTSRTCG